MVVAAASGVSVTCTTVRDRARPVFYQCTFKSRNQGEFRDAPPYTHHDVASDSPCMRVVGLQTQPKVVECAFTDCEHTAISCENRSVVREMIA